MFFKCTHILKQIKLTLLTFIKQPLSEYNRKVKSDLYLMLQFWTILIKFLVLKINVVCFFVCLLFSSHSRIFHSYGDVTITEEGLQFFSYARHSRPLNSEGSLACHTYYDTGQSFIMLISKV